jgi:hypothetical protein
MSCSTCPQGYIESIVEGVTICSKETYIENIVCPDGCTLTILENGNAECSCIDIIFPVVGPSKVLIDFNNTDYFEEVSWTVAYKPLEGQWVSYYSFTPDYYINHNHYFQTGLNYYKNSEWTGTLSSHLLTNKSFCVFYGEKYPFIAELPVKNEYVTKVLESVEISIEARRYQNAYDYSVNKEVGFTQATIYNSTQNSGRLNLYLQKRITDIARYPKTNLDNSQDILYFAGEGSHTFNYFFNRTKNQNNNTELWTNDKVRVGKSVNPDSVGFKGKTVLERIKGDYFLLRLEATDTQHGITLKSILQKEKIN